MPKTFLFERSFNVNTNFLSWATATTGAGSFSGIDDPSLLHYVGFDDILSPDDEVIIPVALFAGQKVNIDVDFGMKLTGDSIDLQAVIVDAFGNAVRQDDSGALDDGSVHQFDPNFSFTAATTGVYFLVIAEFRNNYAGDFEFENDGEDVGSFQVDISTSDAFGFINFGTNADNVLDFTGDDFDDRIAGLGGNDLIQTGGGRNVVDAGDGADTVIGGEDSDQVFGDLGRDSLIGNGGVDVLVGGGGDDFIMGGAGADQMYGGGGIDTVSYADSAAGIILDLAVVGGQNTVGSGVEALGGFENAIGGLGNDRISGSFQNNRLEGLGGNDFLSGRGGEDTLLGSAGRDTLQGGGDTDVFLFTTASDMGTGRAQDMILDFVHQVDIIHLRGIDANVFASGNQEFDFIGRQSFSGTAGELRFDRSGSRTLIQMDTDGDGIADMAITIDRRVGLTAGDFIL